MKSIALLSDTHSYLDARLWKHLEPCDEIWHAGDFGNLATAQALADFRPLRGVYGNIDGPEIRALFPLDLYFELEDVPVYMTHIGGYPGRYAPRVRTALQERTPRGGLFISGHSHILKIMPDRDRGFLHINPGACGLEGWHKVQTLVRFVLDGGQIKAVEVVELSRSKTS